MKAPYTFPHKSRRAIAEYLADRQARSYHYQRYAFVWNVKTYGARFDSESLRRLNPDLDLTFDPEWESMVESDDGSMFWGWCEDAARHISGGEWTSYPGNDQGDWDFSFAGRSGGWLLLEKWRGHDVRNVDPADFLDPDLWSWSDLVAFYRGIRCADSDFTPEKAAAEIMHQAAWYRGECWEAEKRKWMDSQARDMAESIMAGRPDLTPCCA